MVKTNHYLSASHIKLFKSMKLLAAYCILLLAACNGKTKTVQQMNLYPANIPGALQPDIKEKIIYLRSTQRIYNVTQPTLTKFEPAYPNGTAVIICPGGSYMRLSIENEGDYVASALNKKGITAFVLKYRLPNDSIMANKSFGPLQDIQQAIRMVRKNAASWNLKSNKIGVMGFSAGGHLASCAAVHFNFRADKNEMDTTSVRPDFAALIYPVINLYPGLVHRGSRDNLLGPNPSRENINFFSTDLQVTDLTPPTFLVHAQDDDAVPFQNSVHFYDACLKNKVPAEIHLYPKGGHGFGLRNSTAQDEWIEKFFSWLDKL